MEKRFVIMQIMAAPQKAKNTPRRSLSSNLTAEDMQKISPTKTATLRKQGMALRIPKKYVIMVGVVIILAILAYGLKSLFVVATVNGQPITRLALVRELEKQGGKPTLNSMITKTLIEQEAARKHVSVSQKDVDGELKKIEQNLAKQSQTLDQVLLTQGMNRDTLVDQIRIQKLLEKLVGTPVITDAEVNDYIEKNKSTIPEGANINEVKKSVKEQLRQQKLNLKVQTLLDTLRKNAKISYFINY